MLLSNIFCSVLWPHERQSRACNKFFTMGDLYESAVELPEDEDVQPLEDEDVPPSFEQMKSKQATKQSVLHDCRCFFFA